MKYWNDFEGGYFFNRVFRGLIEIGEIKLVSMVMDNVGSTVTLSFNIKELPDKPPLKWRSIEYNACRIGFACDEVSEINVKNLPTTSLMKVSIERHDSRFRISVAAGNSSIDFTAAHLRLGDPSVYFTDDVY